MTASRAPQRALVLSAGRGERLRPLTDELPKPLLPVLGETVGERTLHRLAELGVQSAAVNLHHLGTLIRERWGPSLGGMPLVYSAEERLLGTLGPFGLLQEFFAGVDPVLLINGDSLCRWPIAVALRAHRGCGADATLLLSSRADPEAFGGGVVTDHSGRVLSFRGEMDIDGAARRGVFAGMHLISGSLLAGIEPRPADIVGGLYESLLAAGAFIQGIYTGRRWHDLGRPSRYLDAVLEMAQIAPGAASIGGSWYGPGVAVATDAEVSTAVLEREATVESGASVRASLLLDGSRVGRGSEVVDSILGPGVELGTHAHVRSQMVTRRRPGSALRPKDTPVGDLFYTPLGREVGGA